MAIIQSQIDRDSSEFAANEAHMRTLVADLQEKPLYVSGFDSV